MTNSARQAVAIQGLVEVFRRNGHIRYQNPDRVQNEGWKRYKKGDEVRLIANFEPELDKIRGWLKQMDFKLGKPYSQSNQFRQPIYGRDQVQRFLQMVQDHRLASPSQSVRRKKSARQSARGSAR